MHADELDVDTGPVRRPIAGQFPQWARLPVAELPSTGTDNAMYRLGDDLVVRLPRRPADGRQVVKEQRRLPPPAPRPPLTVPVPLGRGRPAPGASRWAAGPPGRGYPAYGWRCFASLSARAHQASWSSITLAAAAGPAVSCGRPSSSNAAPAPWKDTVSRMVTA
jgi:hypothetical protein